ncbi:NitT/TauT family transport system permease protein [Tistlia consotensis]|uniref:NitT/TauT family transport system permease protein n=1 Tax=Tistlia consotensis USBA 355 TaxID=560819 RepID=A0A1Y6BZQ6_9PROT|nr:ABC transporter permease subunit [Tistlia consotensis]SMF36389.1 NitT/TauT family transport system permease protein [Tistlia consotensis USBA 355]SNR71802.1 NitT/TauT family transport system permease protein [Tistlia consotensis]
MSADASTRGAAATRRAGGWAVWLGALAVLFGTWQAALSLGLLSPMLLPPASAVLATAWDLVRRPDFLGDVGVTLAEVAVAFLVAVPLGIALGVAISESDYWSRVLRPIVFLVFSIPKTIFLPMFILAFGITFAQKVGFGVFSTVFIVLISTFSALESVKGDHVRVARAYGATRRQIALRVYLPSMAPVLLEAVRLAMIFNVTGILLAEMYAARAGLGQAVATWGQNYMLRELLAGILLIAAAAILFTEAVRWLEARCEHWRT